MTETSLSRGESPPNSMNQDYDITRMREDDFERLAVYIVPDVPCERGLQGRAEKTLPRSLALKASLVLSVPNQPVCCKLKSRLNVFKPLFLVRSKVFGAQVWYRKVLALVHLRAIERPAIRVTSHLGDIFGGWVMSFWAFKFMSGAFLCRAFHELHITWYPVKYIQASSCYGINECRHI